MSFSANETVAQAMQHYQAGRLQQALDCCQEVLCQHPDLAEVHHSLGALLVELGRLDKAAEAFEHAVRLRPAWAEPLHRLGDVLQEQGRLAEATRTFEQALSLEPGSARALGNLGAVLEQQGRFDEALECYRRALAVRPDSAPVLNNLGTLYYQAGRLDEAIAAYRRAVALQPNFAVAGSNLLCCLNYVEGLDPAAVRAEHEVWAQQHAVPALTVHSQEPDPERRLRIGYVSPDFRAHSVAWFIEPVLRSHDAERFEVYCYASVARSDEVTARLKRLCPHWREIRHLTEARAVEAVRADGIDILVDLAGHTSHNRLLLFARKPAPVQVTWLGYPNTTGMRAIDYRLTDVWADPPGTTEAWHTEELVRLPRCFLAYQPPGESPDPGALPADRAGGVTFGSFNNISKVTPETVSLWAEVLRGASGSRLLLKSGALAVESVRQRLADQFGEHGVAPDRLQMHGAFPSHWNHLEMYRQVDIGMDTYPYHGTTTTCEALWMGVPVLTLAGRTHVSRVGASLLENAGLGELVVDSRERYVRLALALAEDRARLRQWRAGLREQMARSALTDAARFTRNLEEAYWRMWRRWCEEQNAGAR